MNKFLRQAQELEARLAKAQQELAQETVEASAGGGAITITINGQQKVTRVKLSPEMIAAADTELLEDLILTAINEAIAKSQELAQSRMAALTAGLGLPGLPRKGR